MGHILRATLRDYWSTQEKFYMAFHKNTTKQNRYFHVLRLMHFDDNKNEPDKATTENKNYI